MQLHVFAGANEASWLLTLLKHYMPRPCLSCIVGQADKYLTVDRWITRRRDKVQCEAERSGAVHLITCIKTEQWQDTLMQRYSERCAWLQAITGAVTEVHALFIHTHTHLSFTHSLTHSLTHLVT